MNKMFEKIKKYIRLFNKTMTWSAQRSIATSKVVKSSAVWLIIVPIAAKSLTTLNDVINIQLFGETFKLTTTLPFSWQILFFAACFFTTASVVYSLFCPEIIKKYENFRNFENEKKSRIQINEYLKELTLENNGMTIKEKFKSIVLIYLTRFIKSDDGTIDASEISGGSHIASITSENNTACLHRILDDTSYNDGKNSNAFYYVYNIADVYNKKAVITSYYLYISGFVLITILAIQNIIFVGRSIF